MAKNFYLLKAAKCHEMSSIRIAWFVSADPRNFSKVTKSCKFSLEHFFSIKNLESKGHFIF